MTSEPGIFSVLTLSKLMGFFCISLFCHPDIKPSNVVIDAVSMPLVKGSTLDFATELIGSSFRIAENPQAKGSGCGCGVSWELKV